MINEKMIMKIQLKNTNSLDRYVATNESGHQIELSGDGSAVGPMQAVLMAAAGCSTIDIVSILKKMKQPLESIEVDANGGRREEIPRTYTSIHLHYKLTGALDEAKVARAIELSLTKYCSVSLMLEKSAEITSSYEINSNG